MNKISIKMAIYFIVTFLIMESLLMLYLHQTIVHTRIDEEFSQLVSKGSNHRDILEDNYTEDTMRHIVLMESDSMRRVVITDKEFNMMISSDGYSSNLKAVVNRISSQKPNKDQVIQSNWEDEDFIASLHPYQVNGEQAGYLILFQSTETIQSLVNKLDFHFLLAGFASLVSLFVVYLILSRFLTRPLIRMKEATEKLSKGNFNVKLPPQGNDELGDLSNSIQKLASDLERVKKDRIEFLASISHELRTPLTYLSGYSKVAMRAELNGDDRQKYLSIIDEESIRLTELVKNLFDLAKMDETSFTVSKQSFQGMPFFSHLYERMLPSFNLKNIHLELNCAKSFEVFADPLRLEQIVVNLLDNALKYSNEGTTTSLEVTRINNKTVIQVIDQGIGIHEENHEIIFEKLFRVEKSRSREYGGSGIGLSIVKELVEAHGGSIEVESTLGKGSKFTVVI
ncbi:cell wall metabolism sensor histidine kinase WalK [Paenisporosarcina sp. OV554]|uniref:sensor histidine kinase n=1 Tax=Paenisporosarcina sp. OV554 TaxID=2135694 RepID=UPI000D3C2DB9|nr:HAMP domain-containing sensor histidine kinase [Paenisporosarcina sp. OV554]